MPPANAETMSVPPLMEETGMSAPTLSRSHSPVEEGSGAPVTPIIRTRDRS
ncbi:Uncharacterised protein [Mycobacteroides abscessus subsp. abscessus]|nr:Uncharacterised protein [Mycobacteroides abscessus subsp. abscessus]